MDEAAFYKESEEGIYLRAEGHATALFCPELKARAFARLEAEPPPRELRMDLSACEYMDSTFMGLIVGLNKRYQARTGRRLVLHGLGHTCEGLLRTIGVLKLLEISAEPASFPGPMERVGAGARATAEFLLDAHEELSGLSEENKAKFGSLTELLRKSIGADRSAAGPDKDPSGG